jgi:hypothetical protein
MSACHYRIHWLSMLLLMVVVVPSAFANPKELVTSLSYRLQPVLVHGKLEALDMRMAFDASSSDVVRIKPPQGIGQDSPSRKVTVIGMHAGTLDTAPDGAWTVHASAGKRVAIGYRITSSGDATLPGSNGYQDVLMGTDWFQGLGENLFAHPDDDTKAVVRFE